MLKHEAMKRIFGFTLFCLMVISIQAQNQNVPQGYVDLGLPSGTLWKNSNESGFYSRNAAVNKFDGKLPTHSQWAELSTHCSWSWIGNGYKITGANGAFIVLPALGSSDCDGDVIGVGKFGDYWSFSPLDGMSDFSFDELDAGTLEGVTEEDNPDLYDCKNFSVRLVR